jgi:hypothetical protein
VVDPLNLRDLAWALTSVAELVLFAYLLRQKLYRSHPAFLFYISAAMLQSVTLYAAYRHWGFRSAVAWNTGWRSHGMLACARWLATIEIARRLLRGYSGIWGLAKRALLLISITVLAYSALFWSGNSYQLVMQSEHGVELAIASFIVTLLLFARYYRVPVYPLERALAIGFFLYSCFSVINFSLFKPYFATYATVWNFLSTLTFFASLMIWIYGVRTYSVEEPAGNSLFLSPEHYGKLSGQLNLRLRLLNDQLAHLLRSEDPRP